MFQDIACVLLFVVVRWRFMFMGWIYVYLSFRFIFLTGSVRSGVEYESNWNLSDLNLKKIAWSCKRIEQQCIKS